ncbi:acyltransferase [Pedobacter sp. ASV1-7]|uniref:acyltransferase n=1 Tax=Pedobacter sp. ASV1-7 TaxID=3145237 RepID=UPI0032E921FA
MLNNANNSFTRNFWVDYLRSALTVLVVAHHSALAYTTFAKFDKKTYIFSTHPIVDSQRWVGIDLFQNFNDVFFMSLMFLIGGLFLSKSIDKKGVVNYVRDRIFRLLIPFFFLGTIFMLIAYFPSYYVANNKETGIVVFVYDFFHHQKWPSGPPWFIWVLFLFNLIGIPFQFYFKKLNDKIAVVFDSFGKKPLFFFVVFYLFTWVVFVPLTMLVGPGIWVGYGPFDFQLSRILLYFGYFTIGVLIGNSDFNKGIFSIQSGIVKNWKVWAFGALVTYAVLIRSEEILTKAIADGMLTVLNAHIIYWSVYVASCVLSNLAFLTIFRNFMDMESIGWNLLNENAYLIYLLHYIFVIWIQFCLLSVSASAWSKFLLTFFFAFILSFLVSSFLRKIRLVNKYL